MITTLLALIPVMFLIALGYMLRSRNFIDMQFWLPCEKLNYFWLFPALMFSQVASADLGEFPVKPGSTVSLDLAGIKQTVRSCIFLCHSGSITAEYLYWGGGSGSNLWHYRVGSHVD